MVLGDSALIALIYFAIAGNFDFLYAAYIALLGTIIADCIWYSLGRFFPSGLVFGWIRVPKIKQKYFEFSAFFERHSLKAIFYSKFFVGLRTPIRALYGAQKLPLFPFIIVNFFAALVWILLISLLAFVLRKSLPEFENVIQDTILALSVLGFATVILVLLAKKYLVKKIHEEVLHSEEDNAKSNRNV